MMTENTPLKNTSEVCAKSKKQEYCKTSEATVYYKEKPISKITINKSMSPSEVYAGDIVTVRITVVVPDVEKLTSLVVSDDLPDGLTFIANSITINGTAKPGVTPDNIVLPTSINVSYEIVFQCIVD